MPRRSNAWRIFFLDSYPATKFSLVLVAAGHEAKMKTLRCVRGRGGTRAPASFQLSKPKFVSGFSLKLPGYRRHFFRDEAWALPGKLEGISRSTDDLSRR